MSGTWFVFSDTRPPPCFALPGRMLLPGKSGTARCPKCEHKWDLGTARRLVVAVYSAHGIALGGAQYETRTDTGENPCTCSARVCRRAQSRKALPSMPDARY
eukprot:2395798-Rhodomonas_salina.1